MDVSVPFAIICYQLRKHEEINEYVHQSALGLTFACMRDMLSPDKTPHLGVLVATYDVLTPNDLQHSKLDEIIVTHPWR